MGAAGRGLGIYCPSVKRWYETYTFFQIYQAVAGSTAIFSCVVTNIDGDYSIKYRIKDMSKKFEETENGEKGIVSVSKLKAFWKWVLINRSITT